MINVSHDYYATLHRIMNGYATVSADASGLIMAGGEIQMIAKGDTVFHEKRFNGFEYFQFEGISQRFNVDHKFNPITTGIYQHETVITPHFARTPKGLSVFSLQALTDCVFLTIPAGQFREISDQNTQVRMFGRAVVEREFMQSLRFEELFRSHSAKDRLFFFRENYPNLENLVPHTVIASFLGITPVSLSRLRHDLASVRNLIK
jgi:hypothetical protein